MTTLYWQIFKNLEREFLQLAEIIHIDDTQLTVYSMKIADLLIRTVIEIEALSKELYLANGGDALQDSEMYFDTVCINYLDGLWALEKKVVFVVAPTLYLEQESNKILTPLRKASKRGTSSAIWNRAYQAVKHNRVKELKKGNLINLLLALAALYVLNLYYNDKKILNVSQSESNNLDSSFGSDLFAVKIHIPNGISSDGHYHKKPDFNECIYIGEYEKNCVKKTIEALAAFNDYTDQAIKEILNKKIKERYLLGLDVNEEWLKTARNEARNVIYPVKDPIVLKKLSILGSVVYDIVLNKQ